MAKSAFIFAGQGSQTVGMGRDLAAHSAAQEVFERTDSALGEKLSAIMWEGDEARLTLTENTQPALMAVSLAVLRVLEARGISVANACAYVAGHSLGEYTALTAAGALRLEDTARLLRLRGRAMQEAVPVGVGAMAALLGLDFDKASEIAQAAATAEEICEAANDNAEGQVVISGHKAAIDRAIELAKEAGAKRAMLLPVSAPFHCRLMQPAADAMQAALAETEIMPPCVPVIANITALPTQDPDEIRRLLVEQVTGRVRWRESMLWLANNGVSHLVELGAGKVLTGMARRIDKRLNAQALNTLTDIENFTGDEHV